MDYGHKSCLAFGIFIRHVAFLGIAGKRSYHGPGRTTPNGGGASLEVLSSLPLYAQIS